MNNHHHRRRRRRRLGGANEEQPPFPVKKCVSECEQQHAVGVDRLNDDRRRRPSSSVPLVLVLGLRLGGIWDSVVLVQGGAGGGAGP